jgi:hypothetical protein
VLAAGALVATAVAIALTRDSGEDPSDVAPAEPDGERFFGVNESMLYATVASGEIAAARDVASRIAESGIETVRFATSWHSEEPAPPSDGRHTYDFHNLDAAVEVLAEQGLSASLTLFSTPNWAAEPDQIAACGDRAPPSSPEDFASYAAAVAARYTEDGEFWKSHPELSVVPVEQLEIWNEPNWNGFWCPTADPEAYAELFVAAAEAISRVAPRARIVFAGLTGVFEGEASAAGRGTDAGRFLEDAVSHRPEIVELADGVGLHPYDADVAGMLERATRFKEAMADTGLGGLPLLLSEVGWSTQGSAFAVSDERRGDLLAELASSLWNSRCGITEMDVYAWRTPEGAPGIADLWYGIADPESGATYGSAEALAAEIARLRASGSRPSPATGDPC